MIRFFTIASMRALRTVYFPVLMIILAVTLYFAPVLGEKEAIPPAGICDYDDTELSRRVVNYLTQNGYTVFDNEEAMRKMISEGKLNCGAVINEGFESLMYADMADNAVTFIKSPLTYSGGIYQSHISAAIFGEIAPIIAAGELSGTNITEKDISDEYKHLTDTTVRFSLDVETVESNEAPAISRPMTYLLTAASFMIFAVIMHSVCSVLWQDLNSAAPRIGIDKTIIHLIIPDIAVRILGISLSVVISALTALWIRGNSLIITLLPSIFAYTLFVTALAIVMFAVLRKRSLVQVFSFFVLILSLIFCPIYMDISVMLRWAEDFRVLAPPYWLWICADHPLSLICALPLSMLSLPAVRLRFSK